MAHNGGGGYGVVQNLWAKDCKVILLFLRVCRCGSDIFGNMKFIPLKFRLVIAKNDT